MKIKFTLLVVVMLIAFGCEITVTPSMLSTLKVTNETSTIIWIEIDNGSSTTLYPNNSIEQTWELTNSIVVTLEYGDDYGNSVNTSLSVQKGQTTIHNIYETVGYLQIDNQSSAQIWYEIDNNQQEFLNGYELDTWSWNLLEYQQEYIDFDYSGYHVFTNHNSVNIEGGYITEMDIYPDGGGIKIWNNFSYTTIYAIFLSPSSDGYWGNDDLSGYLYSGESAFWTVEPGWWDIKVVDEYGYEYEIFDRYISLDETSIFYTSGWNKSEENIGNEKNKISKISSLTKDKTELRK